MIKSTKIELVDPVQGADAVGSHARTQGQVQTQEESQARGENPTKIQTSILPTRSDRTNLTLDELDGKKTKLVCLCCIEL